MPLHPIPAAPLTMEEYDRRAAWEAPAQSHACRAILARHGLGAEVADEIDWIYRPALEQQEHRINQLEGVAP